MPGMELGNEDGPLPVHEPEASYVLAFRCFFVIRSWRPPCATHTPDDFMCAARTVHVHTFLLLVYILCTCSLAIRMKVC